MTLLEKINALSANGGRNFTPKRVTFVILSLLMALSDVKAKVGKSLLLQDLTKKLNGKVMKFTNLFENDVIDGDRITHRELMFMGARTSGTYNIRVIGKYLNIRREADGVTTILNSNLDTHGQESTLQIVAVSGAKYYIEGALTYLDCYNNQLTTLDVSKCTALTELHCGGNQLTSLDVSKCTALTELYCYNNQLTTLDVSKCTALTYLDCSSNQLTTLDVSKCTALNELYCYENQLTMLYFGARQNEIQIVCYENNAPILNIAPNSSNMQILYSQSVTDEGLTAEQIRPMLNALHNVTNCLLAFLDETGVVTAELADAIAVAENKGWEIVNSEY